MNRARCWRHVVALMVVMGLGVPSATRAQLAGVVDAQVQRRDAQLAISWRSDTPVDVYLADRSDAPQAQRRRVSSADTDGTHRLEVQPGTRPYVWLDAREGTDRWVAERVLPLQGGRNFRDLGGYATADGRRVVWGRIYRSGTMAQLTENDYALLRLLGITTICDLRSPREREHEPTQWSRISPSLRYLAWEQSAKTGALAGLLSTPVSDPAVVRKAMEEDYRRGAYDFADRYRQVFDQLADGQAPLAFNCSAGKDRTGRVAALLLTALGVPRETVVADFALSDDVVDYEALVAKRKPKSDSPFAVLQTWSPQARAVVLSSEPAFIEAMFAQIETDYGGVTRFLNRELGVDAAKLARLEALYLER